MEPAETELATLIGALWQLRPTPGDNLYQRPEFLALVDYALARYPSADGRFTLTFPMADALRSLGMPWYLPEHKRDLALAPALAASSLQAGLAARSVLCVYLCPLDWAENPPPVSFGPNEMRLFTADELAGLADAGRLARAFPNIQPDWRGLSQFHWLVVKEQIHLSASPGERAQPFFYRPVNRDLGAFSPHQSKLPSVVEEALFLLLLAPWEDWAEAVEVEWRGFRLPWWHTANRDLFLRVDTPPDAKSLSWSPVSYVDIYGEEHEEELPAHYRLADEASGLPAIVNEETWKRWQVAKSSGLFSSPIVHFIVRAFLTSKVDEFMAHLTALEAALGLAGDYGMKSKSDPHRTVKPTARMAKRVEKLLGDPSAGAEYRDLFDVRSAHVHGRIMGEISSTQLTQARRLSRRVVTALLTVAGSAGAPASRDDYLMGLLD